MDELEVYEAREKEKENFLGIIKELFAEGRIEIEHDFHNEWDARYSDIVVKIDEKEVYHGKNYIGSSGWRDE